MAQAKKCLFCNMVPRFYRHCTDSNVGSTEARLKCNCGTWVYSVPITDAIGSEARAVSALVTEWNSRLSHCKSR